MRQTSRDFAYKAYVTDALRFVTFNTAAFVAGGQYGTIEQRYVDLIDTKPKPPKEEDKRSVREIVTDMWAKLNERRGTDGFI